MDLLNCLLLLFMAGLDTVASESSYAMLHLATHSGDRQRIANDPAVIPHAVEEMLRVYPIVQTARKATQDMDFHGCPVKAGDMAAFPLAFANRDDEMFPDARRVDLDRGVTRHIAFGGGPHDASVLTWPAKRWRSCSRSGTSAFQNTSWRRTRSSTAVRCSD